MKNKVVIAFALLLTSAAYAQNQTQTTTTTSTATEVNTSAYVSNPDKLKGLTSETLRPEHAFPALGTFKASGSSTSDVTITLDETNKGIVWVEGLSQGKFKALMKKAPATYKIPAQKTESGKSVPEGTLYVNPETNELTIVLGQSFNDADPTAFLSSTTTAKKNTKAKVWQYTGVKADVQTVVAPQVPQQ